MKNIYQLALRCKRISDERMGTDRNLIKYQNILFTDYTVKGNVDEYLAAIEDLRVGLADKYPNVAYELRLHKEKFDDEKIIHFTALSTIVDCVLVLIFFRRGFAIVAYLLIADYYGVSLPYNSILLSA